jgi:hypothetical protein
MLENLRFNPGETAGDMEFAKEVMSMADIYVNDALAPPTGPMPPWSPSPRWPSSAAPVFCS